jgi:hypothetical protein
LVVDALADAGYAVSEPEDGCKRRVCRPFDSSVYVWLDAGLGTKVRADPSDPDFELFLEVVAAVDGAEARRRTTEA